MLLYENIVKELYLMINEFEIKPGEKLPTERELVDKWKVSRNVIREALHILESRGVIVSQQGKGRFLRQLHKYKPMDDKNELLSKRIERSSLMEAFEVRIILEAKVMDFIVERATDEDILSLEEKYNQMKVRFQEYNRTVGELDLHRAYASNAGNVILEQLLELVFSRILELMHNNFIDVYSAHKPKDTLAAHARIIKMLKERQANAAKEEMVKHLQETINML